MLMVEAVLIIFGLAFGSFVNALVWRLHEKEVVAEPTSPAKMEPLSPSDLSIIKGRSMCPHCHHRLTAADLLPVVSWLWLRGRCRYCKKSISWQYPLVEIITAVLFVVSYIFWPVPMASSVAEIARFSVWLVLLVLLVAMAVYDYKWFILPDKLNFSAIGIVTAWTLVYATIFQGGIGTVKEAVLGVAAGGGLFLALFYLPDILRFKKELIGGGDVKLGFMFGMLLGPLRALIAIYAACLLGTVVAAYLVLRKRLNKSHLIPFGPLLIAGTVLAQLRGDTILAVLKNILGI